MPTAGRRVVTGRATPSGTAGRGAVAVVVPGARRLGPPGLAGLVGRPRARPPAGQPPGQAAAGHLPRHPAPGQRVGAGAGQRQRQQRQRASMSWTPSRSAMPSAWPSRARLPWRASCHSSPAGCPTGSPRCERVPNGRDATSRRRPRPALGPLPPPARWQGSEARAGWRRGGCRRSAHAPQPLPGRRPNPGAPRATNGRGVSSPALAPRPLSGEMPTAVVRAEGIRVEGDLRRGAWGERGQR
jgi:hypothetical protein